MLSFHCQTPFALREALLAFSNHFPVFHVSTHVPGGSLPWSCYAQRGGWQADSSFLLFKNECEVFCFSIHQGLCLTTVTFQVRGRVFWQLYNPIPSGLWHPGSHELQVPQVVSNWYSPMMGDNGINLSLSQPGWKRKTMFLGVIQAVFHFDTLARSFSARYM